MSPRIFIPDDVVVDGEIPKPLAGIDIPEMAVRLARMRTADGHYEFVEGTVEWSRADELNQLFESVVATSTFRMLTQDSARGRLPDVGERVTIRGSLSCVRSYEFEAFDLPDIRQPWRVTAVLSQNTDGYIVEAEPVGLNQPYRSR